MLSFPLLHHMIAQRIVHRQSSALVGGAVIILLIAGLGFLFLTNTGAGNSDRENDSGNNGAGMSTTSSSTSSSSSSSVQSSAGAVLFTEVSKEQYGGSTDRGFRTVTSSTALTALLSTMENPPSISANFDTSTILVAFAGEKITGGYSIDITGVTEQNGVITVQVLEKKPDTECLVAQVVTSPYHIVLIREPNADVEFEIKEEVELCPGS